MNNEANLIIVAQLCEGASLLIMIGVLLWLFQQDVEEALFSDKNYLDVRTIAAMLIIFPFVAASVGGIYFLPELWWAASISQWLIVFMPAKEFAEKRRKQRRE